jgi:HlyD family secretion protein
LPQYKISAPLLHVFNNLDGYNSWVLKNLGPCQARLLCSGESSMQNDQKRKKRVYLIIGGVIAAIIIVLAILLFARPREESRATGEGEIVKAFIGDLSSSATASGQVRPRREATLSVEMPGRVVGVHTRVGDEVQAGEILMELDTGSLALDVAAAEQNLRLKEANLADLLEEPTEGEVAAAEAAVLSARSQLNQLLAGADPEEIAASEAELRAAEANVWSSSAQLNQTSNAIKRADIAASEAAVAAAESNLKSVEIQYTRNPEPDDITANTALAEARENLASAQAQLDLLLAGPDENQVGNAQAGLSASTAQRDATQAQLAKLLAGATASQIAGAEAQLAQAQATLDNLLSGASEEQIAAAEAEVEQARINLEDAQETLAESTLTAPFDGVVTAVNFNEGEFATGEAVKLIDDELLEVVLEVDEIDIGAMAVGQPATLTLETWPSVDLDSKISKIVPRAKNSLGSGLVVYEVHLPLQKVSLPVRTGMTADANLITAEITDVLLVPNQAIDVDRTNGSYSVMLVVGDSVEQVPVMIGLRDNQFTQIKSGLSAGDELAVGNTIPLAEFGPGGEGPSGRGN